MTKASPASNKPRPLDKVYCQNAADLLKERYTLHLEPGELISIGGELAHGHTLIECILEVPGGDRLRFETCVETEPNKLQNPLDARDIALNTVEKLLGAYFEEERMVRFLALWQEHDFDGRTVLVRGERTVPHLDEEADRLLRAHGFDEHGDAGEDG